MREEILVSIPNGQRKLGVGRSTVYLLMGSGELKSVKIGTRRLITQSSIDAFIERLTQIDSAPTPEAAA